MKGTVLDEQALVMADDDNVATALTDLEAGERLTEADPPLTVAEAVPFGHKVALVDIEAGETVRKYGEVIGVASVSIDRGAWVHTHNCESTRGRGDQHAAAAVGDSGGPDGGDPA